MEVFTTIIKLISHLGILGALIFSFVFQTHLEGWFDWTIFITLCIIGICNIVFLIATNDECDEKARPSVAGLMDFILLGSMVIRVLNNGCDPFLIPYAVIALVAVSGINRFTMNLLFIQANLYLICTSVTSFSWHAIILIVVSVIMQITMLLNVFIARCDGETEVDEWEYLNPILGLLVIVGTISYLLLWGNITIISNTVPIFLIYYIIVSLSSCISDNRLQFASVCLSVMLLVGFLYTFWLPSTWLEWILYIIVGLLGIVLVFTLCANDVEVDDALYFFMCACATVVCLPMIFVQLPIIDSLPLLDKIILISGIASYCLLLGFNYLACSVILTIAYLYSLFSVGVALTWIDWILFVFSMIAAFFCIVNNAFRAVDDEDEIEIGLSYFGLIIIASLIYRYFEIVNTLSIDLYYLYIPIFLGLIGSIPNFSLLVGSIFVTSLLLLNNYLGFLSLIPWVNIAIYGGISIGAIIVILTLILLFAEAGLYAFKYIAHTISSGLFIVCLIMANINQVWLFWLLCSLGVLLIILGYILLYKIRLGYTGFLRITLHIFISICLTIYTSYGFYTGDNLILLIISIVSFIVSSCSWIIVKADTQVHDHKKVKPDMQYDGDSMTCPYCRERYVETWVKGVQTKGLSRDIAKATTNTVIGGVNATTWAGIGATIGSAIPGPGTAIGGAVGFLAGITASVLFKNKVNENVDSVCDFVEEEFSDGIKLEFKCPNPQCGKVWIKHSKYGSIID